MSLTRDWITYPDDPANCYAHLRAWDRHLVSVGLLPIFTSELEKVGPILLGPHAKGKQYIVYGYDERGHLTDWRETVQKVDLSKASGHARGRGP